MDFIGDSKKIIEDIKQKENSKKESHENFSKHLRATAYHEAGHVALFLFFKHKFVEVSIVPSEGRMGHVELEPTWYSPTKRQDGTLTKRTAVKYEQLAIILNAGVLVEAAYMRQEGIDIDEKVLIASLIGDYEFTHYLVGVLKIKNPEEFISGIGSTIAAIFYENNELWQFVCLLTAMLIKKKSLSYRECKLLYDIIIS